MFKEKTITKNKENVTLKENLEKDIKNFLEDKFYETKYLTLMKNANIKNEIYKECNFNYALEKMIGYGEIKKYSKINKLISKIKNEFILKTLFSIFGVFGVSFVLICFCGFVLNLEYLDVKLSLIFSALVAYFSLIPLYELSSFKFERDREKYAIKKILIDEVNADENIIKPFLSVRKNEVADMNYIKAILNKLNKIDAKKEIKQIDKIIKRKNKITYFELEEIYKPSDEDDLHSFMFEKLLEYKNKNITQIFGFKDVVFKDKIGKIKTEKEYIYSEKLKSLMKN